MDLSKANDPNDLFNIIADAIKFGQDESKKLEDLADFMGEQQDKLNALISDPCEECEMKKEMAGKEVVFDPCDECGIKK